MNKLRFLGPLHAGTENLHHAVERTAVGTAMSEGNPSPEWYMGWLVMKRSMYSILRPVIPARIDRTAAFSADLEALGVLVIEPAAVPPYLAWCNDPDVSPVERERRLTGAAYVLVGSVLMGGPVIAQRLAPHLPRASFESADRDVEMALLRQMRQRGDCILEARMCFSAMLEALREIETWGTEGKT